MQTLKLWMSVVGFLLLGALSLAYLFMGMGEVVISGIGRYTVYAEFSNASGLDPGAPVEIAGVRVGQVRNIRLIDTRARVALSLQEGVRLQDDTIASIQTKGLLGGRYVLITPGGSDQLIPPRGKIRETESPLDIPGLIAAYVSMRNKSTAASANVPTPSP